MLLGTAIRPIGSGHIHLNWNVSKLTKLWWYEWWPIKFLVILGFTWQRNILKNFFFLPPICFSKPAHFNSEHIIVEFLKKKKTTYLASVAVTLSNNSPFVLISVGDVWEVPQFLSSCYLVWDNVFGFIQLPACSLLLTASIKFHLSKMN